MQYLPQIKAVRRVEVFIHRTRLYRSRELHLHGICTGSSFNNMTTLKIFFISYLFTLLRGSPRVDTLKYLQRHPADACWFTGRSVLQQMSPRSISASSLIFYFFDVSLIWSQLYLVISCIDLLRTFLSLHRLRFFKSYPIVNIL